ncbi:MAG: tRNA epoxyqueuosine(34) reductase QueG, partial [Balneolaceae bacterium]
MDKLANTLKIRRKAYTLGFGACGFARAEPLDREAYRLESWLKDGRHGSMHWMENHFDKRVNPTKLVPGAKSIISVLGSYHFEKNLEYDRQFGVPKIAKYARGRDYHKVFKQKLFKLFDFIIEEIGDVHGRVFVDSAPVMDKVWAERAGIGWIGKNSNLLNKEHGSFFLIGEIILNLECVYDTPGTDHCGTCTKCIEACPTDAIHEPYRIDSNRCISYLTIELKEKIPQEYHQAMGEWMFGCDICQDVCPWNRKAKNGQIEDLFPRDKMFIRDPQYWEEITEEQYENLFNGTPVRRAKYPKFKENATIVAGNLQSQSITREKS